ncbi:MAG: SCO family protein [Gemmatimonadaceae bacterium]
MPHPFSARLTRWALAPRRRATAAVNAATTAAAVALLAGCAASAPAADTATVATGYHGTMLPAPVEMPAVVLTRTDGTPYDLRAEGEGHVTLLFFGYTNCPDVCPVHMANIAAVTARMPYDETRRLKVLFVTIDPERDTPEKLEPWLARFDPRFIALTGDSASLHDAQAALDLTPARKDTTVTSAAGYAMAHAAQIYAFTADGRAHVVYPFGTRQADWAEDLPRLVREQWATAVSATDSGGSR